MSFENAKQNLEEFSKELGLTGLEFDKNNTCILGIDDQFSVHLTYEPNSDRLYIYAPLLDGLPKTDDIKLKMYEFLLEGALLGGKMAGGGVGVAPQEELVLVHCTLDMAHAEANTLRQFAAIFVEMVERWRKICADLAEGKEPTDPGPSTLTEPAQSSGGAGGPAPGGIKI